MIVEEAGLRIRPWGLRKTLNGLEEMGDDLVFLVRRAAYVDEIRAVALRTRRLGWLLLLLAAMTFAWSATRGPGVHSDVAHAAEAAFALGWVLFFYVMFKRTRYVRRHPFHPDR